LKAWDSREGDAGDAADMVAWMQGYRLGGLEALNRGLNYLLNEGL